MKLSVINSFLTQATPYSALKKKMEEEVAVYNKLRLKKGARATVIVDEDAELQITVEHLEILCKTYLKGEIENHEMYFIVDALLLSEYNSEGKSVSFANEDLREKFDCLTDPDLNYGELTPDIVTAILKS